MDKAIIKRVQECGFDVYMRNAEKDTWLHFVRGDDIGYLQYRPYEGFTFGTVHKPSKDHGTGYQVERHVGDFDKERLERCFDTCPAWARNRHTIRKYSGIDEFLNRDSWNRGYTLVPPVDGGGTDMRFHCAVGGSFNFPIHQMKFQVDAVEAGLVGAYHGGKPYQPDRAQFRAALPYRWRKAFDRAEFHMLGNVPNDKVVRVHLHNRRGHYITSIYCHLGE